MSGQKSLEEAAAALIAAADDGLLRKAVAGDFGEKVRLLSLGEKVRRDQRKRGAAASGSAA